MQYLNEIQRILTQSKAGQPLDALAEYARHASIEQLRELIVYVVRSHSKNVEEQFLCICQEADSVLNHALISELTQELLLEYSTSYQMLERACQLHLLDDAPMQALILALAANDTLPITNTSENTEEDHPLVRLFKTKISGYLNETPEQTGTMPLQDVELLLAMPFRNRVSHKKLYHCAQAVLPFRTLNEAKIQVIASIIESAEPQISEWLLDRLKLTTNILKNKKARGTAYQLLYASLMSGSELVFQKLMKKPEILKCIIDNQADFDNPKKPIMFVAAESTRYHTAVPLFLQLGMKSEIRDRDGMSVLHYLYHQYRENAVERLQDLIQLGIPADTPDQNGKTVLMLAVEAGDEQTTELLLRTGSNPKITSDAGKTAHDYAVLAGNTNILKKLIQTEKASSFWSRRTKKGSGRRF